MSRSPELFRRHPGNPIHSFSIVMLPFELISSMRHVPLPIVPTMDSSDDDVIVIGSRGKSAAARFLMGSVSERVVRHATRPVLVVR